MLKKFAGVLLAVGLGIAIWLGLQLKSSVIERDATLRLRGNWTMDSLANQLQKRAGLKDKDNFKVWAERLRYTSPNPCFLEVKKGDDIWALVKRLKANRYQTINVVINPEYDLEKVAKAVSSKLEIGEAEFINAMQDDLILETYGLNKYNWQALFMPNTYEFFVKSDLPKLLDKMNREQNKFWNEERLAKAKKQGFDKLEVINLASIATKESHKVDELKNIVGVYINRLRIGMPLGADPTINFAKDTSGRVLYEDLNIDSRYNTYKYAGLPPGPICIPHPKAIDAVLNYKKHNYLYFCAKDDFSGYHAFAETLWEHEKNADKWRKALRKFNREKRENEK